MKKNMHDTIMDCLIKSSSQAPMAYSALEDCVFDARPESTTDEFASALEKLCDKAKVRAIRGERGGVWQNLYWPIVAATTEKKKEAEPMTKGQIMLEILRTNGPLPGSALAALARKEGHDIPAKNVPALLVTLIKDGKIISIKHKSINNYMTPEQAKNFPPKPTAQAAKHAHAMSAPPVEDEAMPEPDPVLLALANKMMSKRIDDLEGDIKKQRALLDAKTDLIADLEIKLQSMINGKAPLAYAIIPAADDVMLFDSEFDARARASDQVMQTQEPAWHVVAIMDTAELSVGWSRGA